MPTYLGNPSLSNAVKDRVISTFQQALTLYKQGRSDEAMSGCNLMLQMDPMFEPARKLVEKMRNPNAPIDVDTLLPNSDDDALREARTAMATRDFPRVVQITTEILTNDLMNDAARILADEARDKLEAAPFVDQFVAKCEKSLNAGDIHGAKTALEKARALDAEHPAISKMSQMINARGAFAPAPAAPAASGFDFGTSFVVDAPPPTVPGRGTAQATDFGFTFEEEKPQPADGGLSGFSFDPEPPPPAPKPAPPPAPAPPPKSNDFSFDAPSSDAPFAGFSFDSPNPAPTPAAGGFNFDAGAPKAPASGNFDFATASIETSAEDQQKIQQYMTDGDRAFEAGDYQKAIDLWSRIFLIDVTNEQASERIERAKQKRKEIEQQNESILAAGIAAFDRNDRETARGKFAEVLRNEPNNITAQDYMDRLSDTVTEGGAAGYESSYTPPDTEKFDIFAEEPPSGEMLMPPDPGDEDEAAPSPSAKKGAAKKTGGISKAKPAPVRKPLPLGLIATIIGVLVVAGGGWFAWQKFSKPVVDTTSTDQVISRAQSLVNKGKYDQAILMLQDIKPEDPQHDKALLMINDIQKKKAQASEMIDGRPAALVYQEGLANGKSLYDSHDYDGAKKAFEAAMRVKALTPEMKTLYDTAAQQVAKLDSAKSLFNEHQYADALANLQQLQQGDPENKNIQRLIEDAHFNLGAVALQNENLTDAVKQFDEVLKLDATDDLAKRSRELAIRYQSEPKDLLYRIYVKYLPLRTAA
jgi:tetratricopeptide (TPR) repeat protein